MHADEEMVGFGESAQVGCEDSSEGSKVPEGALCVSPLSRSILTKYINT